ncbi:uncharacterized protein [Diadema setosum]|uniref:uncharacterized protein n=1 Tax=Diadema setosum TaxID=31175 RepID=UPI003B3A838D
MNEAAMAKPVSAPARMSSRDDIWKDIRDWAKPSGRGEGEETEDGDQSRVIGSQIKDNITEQRLLESRLLDLSKERYKFIVHVAWQRKAFIDKQKSKTGVMKDLLRNVDTSLDTCPAKQDSKNQSARLAEKLTSYRDLVKKTYSEQRRMEMLKKVEDPDEMRPIIPGTYESIYKTEPTFSARNRSRQQHGEFGLDRRRPHNLRMFPAITPSSPKPRQQSVSPSLTRRPTTRLSSTSNRLPEPNLRPSAAAIKPSTTIPGSRYNVPRYLKYRSVYDGRFKGLERSLSATYDGSSGPSIESILDGLPTRSMSVAL